MERQPTGPATQAAGLGTEGAWPETRATGPGTVAATSAGSTADNTAGNTAGNTAAATGTAAAPGTGAAKRRGRGSRRNRRSVPVRTQGQLGAGLVDVPPVPPIDPVNALLPDPQVTESKRFCRTCGRPVGRAVDGAPAPVRGHCPEDGTPFSFAPKLAKGDLVAGQYDVQGCLTHGGLGWIYLALDRNVENRWVVLKGLVDEGDADAMAAAIAERRFLAQVSHPNIVTIHNFVQHPGDNGAPVGYIVMEYVGGSSLKDLLELRRTAEGALDPLPVPQALAYTLDVLPALGHLHSLGLAYCDFKPENVIQYDRRLKIIDLGAVIGMDDWRSALFGTVGYQAPEILRDGPSAASDIYTVGRALAVLALGMPPTSHGAPTDLPTPDTSPVLARYESLHRLLRRATDPDPARRFVSTDEMADQVAGVLREVLALADGQARPAPSTVFGPAPGGFAPELLLGAEPDRTRPDPGRPDPRRVAVWLPIPLVDPADPAAALLASAPVLEPAELARWLDGHSDASRELSLRLARSHLAAGEMAVATTLLDELTAEDPDDWRLDWLRALAALAIDEPEAAEHHLDAVFTALPGEPAAKLALAAAAECAGDDATAARYYALVAQLDPSLIDAVFGLARVRIRAGDRDGAVRVLDTVPEGSNRYVTAQLSAVQVMLLDPANRPAVLRTAAHRVRRLHLDQATEQGVLSMLLSAAVEAAADHPEPDAEPFLDCPWRERELRLALERCLRSSARLATGPAERIALVDRANAIRPRTLV